MMFVVKILAIKIFSIFKGVDCLKYQELRRYWEEVV